MNIRGRRADTDWRSFEFALGLHLADCYPATQVYSPTFLYSTLDVFYIDVYMNGYIYVYIYPLVKHLPLPPLLLLLLLLKLLLLSVHSEVCDVNHTRIEDAVEYICRMLCAYTGTVEFRCYLSNVYYPLLSLGLYFAFALPFFYFLFYFILFFIPVLLFLCIASVRLNLFESKH